ncbi:MAG: hypothetical protein K0S18_8 [Anaerocolumna sp.]|jgi:hypothetical protein|nr:hypothetical protein [Anaerocolumna sp.]
MAINYESDIVYNIDVDFHSLKHLDVVYTKQYDENSRYIVANVWKDSEIYTIPDGAIAIFACTKRDNNGIFNQCIIENNQIIYPISLQTTILDGNLDAEFRLYKTIDNGDGTTMQKLLSTPKFKIRVDKSALDDNTVISTNEFNALTDAMNSVGDLIFDMNDAISRTETAITNAEIATENAINATNIINQTNINVQNAEDIRIQTENQRIASEELRPDYFYVTQAEYDALPQTDKDNPKNIYEITDNDGVLPTELQNLIDNAVAATDAANQAADGVLSDFGTVGTYTKVTTDIKGRVQSGTTPTAIADLGITNVYTKTEVDTKTGDLATLNTTNKENIVNAINEHDTEIGDLSALTTIEKTNLVGSVNEVNSQLAEIIHVEKEGDTDDEKIFNAITKAINGQEIIFSGGKIYEVTTPILVTKQIVLNLNGATINYTGTGYWLNYSDAIRLNSVIKNGKFTGNDVLSLENCAGFHIENIIFANTNKYALKYKGVLWVSMKNVFFQKCGFRAEKRDTGINENNILIFDKVEIQGDNTVTLSPVVYMEIVKQVEFRSFSIENFYNNEVLRMKDCEQIYFNSPWFERVITSSDSSIITFDNCFNIKIENAHLSLADTLQNHKYFINMINKCGTLHMKSIFMANYSGKGFICTDYDNTVIKLEDFKVTSGSATVHGGIPILENININSNAITTMSSVAKNGLSTDINPIWLTQSPTINRDFDSSETNTDTGLSGVVDTSTFLTAMQSYRIDVLGNGVTKQGSLNGTSFTANIGDTLLCFIKLKSNVQSNIKMRFTGSAGLGNPQIMHINKKWCEYIHYSSVVASAGTYYPYFIIEPIIGQDVSIWIDSVKVYVLTNSGSQTIPLV